MKFWSVASNVIADAINNVAKDELIEYSHSYDQARDKKDDIQQEPQFSRGRETTRCIQNLILRRLNKLLETHARRFSPCQIKLKFAIARELVFLTLTISPAACSAFGSKFEL